MQITTTPVVIYPMVYPAASSSEVALSSPAGPAPDPAELEARIRELERELEERSLSFESRLRVTRTEALDEGRNMERSEHSTRLTIAAEALGSALHIFKEERDRYLVCVEQEVVRLALAIAARILHRESLMDPLLLSGAVRVALGQLAENTEVRLKVPASEYEMWHEMLRLMPNLPLHPEVLADNVLTTGHCLLETHLGSVDLGVSSQLAEIERGFFDLLEQRQVRDKAASGNQPAQQLGQ